MAKTITRLSTDPRKIARLLQAKAPQGHILAYITPEEADVLKARGGSGKPHADTGIPSYEEEPLPEQPGIGGQPSAVATPVETSTISAMPLEQAGPVQAAAEPMFRTGADVFGGLGAQAGYQPPPATPTAPGVTPRAPEAGGIGGAYQQLAQGLGISGDTLARMGLGGLQAVLGARQARAASAQGQAAKGEMQAMAAPYQQMGQQLRAQAQRGELTPQAQQSLQAAQARAAQQVATQGGVGATQAQTAVENLRQQLLQQQRDYGLQLSNIGDQIALGAIRAGVQADQYVNQLTSSYFSNIARTLVPQAAPAQPAATPGGQ